MNNATKVFLNTWGLYNMSYAPNSEHGYLGYGWMTVEEAIDFINENPERDGGEWFFADVENYSGIEFNCDFCDVLEVLETIQTLEEMEECEREEITALMEYLNTDNINEVLDQYKRSCYTFYSDIDSYHDCCDECLDFRGCNEMLERYFDFDAYHRDCDFDIFEASNGVCIAG